MQAARAMATRRRYTPCGLAACLRMCELRLIKFNHRRSTLASRCTKWKSRASPVCGGVEMGKTPPLQMIIHVLILVL